MASVLVKMHVGTRRVEDVRMRLQYAGRNPEIETPGHWPSLV